MMTMVMMTMMVMTVITGSFVVERGVPSVAHLAGMLTTLSCEVPDAELQEKSRRNRKCSVWARPEPTFFSSRRHFRRYNGV